MVLNFRPSELSLLFGVQVTVTSIFLRSKVEASPALFLSIFCIAVLPLVDAKSSHCAFVASCIDKLPDTFFATVLAAVVELVFFVVDVVVVVVALAAEAD